MLLHHRNLECTGRRSLVIDNRKCSTIRTGVIIQSKTTKLKNPYLRKRVQICAISEKPSAGKYCRLNRNPTEKHSVLKSWLSRYWSVRFEILSLRNLTSQHAESQHFTSAISYLGYDLGTQACLMEDFVKLSSLFYQLQGTSSRKSTQVARNHCFDSVCDFAN